MKKIASLFALTATALAPVSQAESAFQASLTPEIALVEQGALVKGLALNIWGDNQVRGINLGFVNQQSRDSLGFTWSFLGGTVENYKGVIFGGFFTQSTGDVVGWQAALVNLNQGSMTGLQTGFLNYSQNMTGLQLGFINYAKQMHGVQIGLANIVEENPWFDAFPEKLAYGFPFVNWSF
ncbi:MAG: LA_2272 family surface repeat-containing protein [Opitutales bacterium]